MSAELELVPDDIETQAAKAREERSKKCAEGIADVLERYNCQAVINLRLGDQRVPLNSIVNLQGEITIEAKVK